jgi:mono/diheme cytochrome c family protein
MRASQSDPQSRPRSSGTDTPSTASVRSLLVFASLALAFLQIPRASGASAEEGIANFERRIRPLLAEHCVSCHGAEKQKGGLRLDSPEGLRTGGDKGAVLVEGQPTESLLIRAVSYTDEELKMPPKTRLSPAQVKLLSDWIASGAPMPAPAPGSVSPAPRASGFTITPEARAHWAFQPVARPPVPAVRDSAWVRNPIDAFLLSKLEARGLAPNPTAPAEELLRRATYNLTGLPPTPEAVREFVVDPSTNAWSSRVDRLLDSPQYGEKWARHWLDLVRYAESNSYERDGAKPHAWRYRDYVIRSLNQDKPYDRFVREQLAGDELPEADSDALIATGFFRLGIWDDEPADRELARYDAFDDIITTTGQTLLGLTVDCARCHNHKIDPISQADYYRLLAFFRNIQHYKNGGPTDEAPVFPNRQAREDYQRQTADLERERTETREALAALEKAFLERHPMESADRKTVKEALEKEGAAVLGPELWTRYQSTREKLKSLEGRTLPVEKALVVTEAGPTAPETHVLLRGNPGAHGDRVEPAFPEVLGSPAPKLPTPAEGATSSGRRRTLADWIASTNNPLAARVIVNRLWQHHFGRGLVKSPNNFGLQGDRPTHPELLDWLASELVSNGWSLKAIHRLILNSNTYRMSSRGRPDALAADVENTLFWRFNMRRLAAEEIRDSILAVSGQLNPRSYGPSVYVEIPKAVLATQSVPGNGWGKSSPEDQARRSIYIHAKRSLIVPILDSFDLAETDRTTPVRFASVQPTQALGMINSEFLNQQARHLAKRLRTEAPGDLAAQVRRGFALATSRPARESEAAAGVALVEGWKSRNQSGGSADQDRALENFCLLLLNLNEFMYLD